MKLSTRLALSWLPAACLAALCAKADVGAIPGASNVNAMGGFTYTIPIWLPPGPKGVEPHLALVYDSSVDSTPADNMPLAGTSNLDSIPAGAGWVLEGLSMIQRTNKTVAEDGVASAPAYTALDAYSLDGNRLRLTSSGNYGQAGSTYQTELADFSLITAEGGTAEGPDHWSVQRKDGLTYEYGNTSDSKILLPNGTGNDIREWLLDKVSDVYGNSYTISYGAGASGSSGTAVPTSISWTPSAAGSSTYNYSVSFTYQPRGSKETIYGYTYGTPLENNDLLTSITVKYNSKVVRYYSLHYTPSAVTSRSLLASVEECTDASSTDCLTPTGFAYVQGAGGVAGSSGTALTGAASVVGAYDFNGDGRSDILYVSGGVLWVALSTGSGFNQVDTGIPAPAGYYYLAGHLVSRTRDDILALNNGTWYYYTWNGSGFTGEPTGIPGPKPASEGPAFAALADVNGDGLPDLVTLVAQPSSQGANFTGLISTWLNTSTNGVFSLSSTSSTYQMPYCGSNGEVACEPVLMAEADVDGDGRTDLLVEDISIQQNGFQQTTSYVLLSNGTDWTVASNWAGTAGPRPIHWNSDRCDDFVTYGNEIGVSACNGSPAQSIGLGGSVAGTADWNGDGLDDVLLYDNGVLGIQTSTGNGASAVAPTNITLAASDGILALDVDGDGLPDIAVISGGTVTYYLHNAVGQHADLLSSVTNGNGNTISPLYTSISAGAYTPGTGALDPETDWEGNLWVVQQLTLPDGIGGTYTKTYGYTDARWNRLRGFEGFKEIDVTDSRRGEVRKTSYDLLFPETGMVQEDDLLQSDGTKISTTTYTNIDDELDPTQYNDRHFPYAQEVTTDTYEVNTQDPSYNGKWITHSVTNYAYKTPPDDFGNFTSIDTTITDEDSGSPYGGEAWETTTTTNYVDDTSTWCGTLPASIVVAKTVPSQPALTQTTVKHTTTYTRDSSYCRAKSLAEDAGQSTFDITRQFGYDSFGNVKQVQISGSGFPTRTWTYNWGTTGQFEEEVQDPVAYANNYEEKIGYDYGKGVKTSDVIQSTSGTQDAPPTQWTPDGFGRITQQLFPDGTTLNWTYTACSQTSCNGYPNAFEVVAETAKGSDGSTITDQDTYLDSFGRTVAISKLMLDGSSSGTEREYDQYGNLVKQSVPCNSSGCQQLWTSTLYDALNRPTSISSPDPSAMTPGDVTTTISYTGDKTSVTNAKGQTTSRIVDVTGALRQTLDATGYGQAFTVDPDGNVVQANEAGTSGNFLYSKTYDYGGEGDYVAAMKDRALGSWSYTPDALGDVRSYQDAKGQQFTISYDDLGRMTEREDWTNDASGISCGQGLTCETDTTWQWGVTPGNHDVGQLDETSTTTSDGTYVEQRQYDADGRLSHRLLTVPGDATYEYSLYYNPQGLPSNLQFPAAGLSPGLSLNYSYQNGALAAVQDANAGTVYWQATAVNGIPEVDGLGQVATDTLGNGVVTERWLTPAGGLPSKIISGPTAGSATLQNQTYMYDVLGNVTQRQDSNGQGLTENFPAYDGDNRLQESTLLNSSTNTTTTNLSVSYNPDGSMSQKTETGCTDTPVGYSVHWTSYNYPQSISATLSSGQNESATFDYGPARQRWRMVYTEDSASETTEYIGGLMEKVTSSTGSADYRYYVNGANGLAAIVDIAGSTVTAHYVLEDQEGSISSLLNSTGSVETEESFTAFGNRREASTWSGPPSAPEEAAMDAITRQGFTGQTVLGQMGLNHMNGRVEDAVTGTFLSPDPYVTNPTNTQDYYKYAYVYNNPLRFVDPSGFSTGETCDDGECPPVTITAPWIFNLSIDGLLQDFQSGLDSMYYFLFDIGSAHVLKHANQQQNNPQPQQTCPNGKLAQVARAAVDAGNFAINEGAQFAKTGAQGALISLPALETPPGEAFFAASAFVARVGSYAMGAGLALKLFGGAVLYAEGDPQPLQSAAVQLAQSHLEDNLGMPPLPFTDPLDAVAEAAAGKDGCP